MHLSQCLGQLNLNGISAGFLLLPAQNALASAGVTVTSADEPGENHHDIASSALENKNTVTKLRKAVGYIFLYFLRQKFAGS